MLTKKAKRTIGCIVAGCVLAAGIAFSVVACDMSMETTSYRLETPKVTAPVRIVFISDLHNSLFGEGQKELVSAVEQAQPDIVILGGDIADKTQDYSPDNAYILAEHLGKKYPCYYSIGNHEYARGDSELIKERLSQYGITALEGNSDIIEVKGQKIEVCGIFGADTLLEIDGRTISELELVSTDKATEHYRMLLLHFPEDAEKCLDGNFDLILSGHAHGGQIELFGQGIVAPGQGLFPKFTSGIHENRLVVSRGLANTFPLVPRIGNEREIVVLTVSKP